MLINSTLLFLLKLFACIKRPLIIDYLIHGAVPTHLMLFVIKWQCEKGVLFTYYCKTFGHKNYLFGPALTTRKSIVLDSRLIYLGSLL